MDLFEMNEQELNLEFETLSAEQEDWVNAEIARLSVETEYKDMDVKALIKDAKHFYPA